VAVEEEVGSMARNEGKTREGNAAAPDHTLTRHERSNA
jgi:hypothetical protein